MCPLTSEHKKNKWRNTCEVLSVFGFRIHLWPRGRKGLSFGGDRNLFFADSYSIMLLLQSSFQRFLDISSSNLRRSWYRPMLHIFPLMAPSPIKPKMLSHSFGHFSPGQNSKSSVKGYKILNHPIFFERIGNPPSNPQSNPPNCTQLLLKA